MKNMLCSLLFLFAIPSFSWADTLRVATFNVSMEANNYEHTGKKASDVLMAHLKSGTNPQIRNIAEIIQRVHPDIVMLNEFDYYPEAQPTAAALFVKNYLNVSQHGQAAIDYPYQYVAPVNTGVATPFDLDNDGAKTHTGGDAYGYGVYPGQYGMALLSRYPIDTDAIRSFQLFHWADMPDAQQPVDPATNQPWYNNEEWTALRLSSKSHWDVPVTVNGRTVHILAMHPTPPSFDGPEDRNGLRNHDEIRLMADYLTPDKAGYIYDDKGQRGGFSGERFVLVGDFNAADIGDKHRPEVIEQLTEHPLVNNDTIPMSEGGAEADSAAFSKRFTAHWGARADYVLPSRAGFKVKEAGVFWPKKTSPLYRLVKDRKSSSDHRMVWVDLAITD